MGEPTRDEEPIGARSDKHVGRRVMKGAALMSGARLSLRLFSLVNLVVLSRLLDPHDYGIASLALATIGLLAAASDVKVTQAIVAFRDINRKHLDTGFTIQLLRGVLLGAALLLFAEMFARLSRSPELADPLRVLAIVPIIEGLRNPQFALLQRNIDFSKEFNRTILGAAAGSIVSIAIAFYTQNYWAIVFGTIAQRVAASAATYIGMPGRLGLSLAYWREFLKFGAWLTMTNVLQTVRGNFAPSFIIGRFLGTGAVGYYSIALTLAQLVTNELVMPLVQAMLPGFATIASDKARLRRAYRDAQSTIVGFVVPVAVVTAVFARDLIVLMSGEKWEPAAPLVQILAPVFALGVLNSGTAALAQAVGRNQELFNRNVVLTVVTLPLLWVASAYGDLRWAIGAVAFGSLLGTLITIRMAARIVGSPMLETVSRNWRAFAAAALMAAALHAIGTSSETRTLPLLVALLPKVALGFLIYAAATWLLWRLAGRPQGFETKLLDLVGPRLPRALEPALRRLRGG